MGGYERDWDLKDMAYEVNNGSLDDGSVYDDGPLDLYLGDPDEDYPRGGFDCE
jgi:hypothetical protein